MMLVASLKAIPDNVISPMLGINTVPFRSIVRFNNEFSAPTNLMEISSPDPNL